MTPGPVHKKILYPSLRVFLFSVVMILQVQVRVTGQVTSPAADHVDSLTYSVHTGKDPLFVFFQTNGVLKPGSLSATLPGGGNFTFEWRRYDPSSGGFGAPFQTDADVPQSMVTGLDEGGYRVRVFNGTGTDTSFIAWVMLDDFRAEVEKTADDLVPSYKYTCVFLVVSGFVTPDTLTWYDPLSGDTLSTVPDFAFKWTSDNNDLRIPNDTIVLDPNITYLPPYEDTWYILTATDDFGMVEVDSVFYESIQTKAEFTLEYLDKVTGEFDAELTGEWSDPFVDIGETRTPKGSTDATLTVKFINESLNGATYEWVFLDTLGGIKETETTFDVEETPQFTYIRADEYYEPYLVSTSDAGCIDTFRLEEPIFVEPSQLVIPNVFTPNGDGINDVFYFKHQSLQNCRVTIMDRTGKVVYKKKIEDIYSWEGWDGNVHESGRRAPEGQYFYIVEALGYDGVEYRDLNIIESWRQNRGNKQSQGTGGTSGGTGGTEPEGSTATTFTGWFYLFRHTGTY